MLSGPTKLPFVHLWPKHLRIVLHFAWGLLLNMNATHQISSSKSHYLVLMWFRSFLIAINFSFIYAIMFELTIYNSYRIIYAFALLISGFCNCKCMLMGNPAKGRIFLSPKSSDNRDWCKSAPIWFCTNSYWLLKTCHFSLCCKHSIFFNNTLKKSKKLLMTLMFFH